MSTWNIGLGIFKCRIQFTTHTVNLNSIIDKVSLISIPLRWLWNVRIKCASVLFWWCTVKATGARDRLGRRLRHLVGTLPQNLLNLLHCVFFGQSLVCWIFVYGCSERRQYIKVYNSPAVNFLFHYLTKRDLDNRDKVYLDK